MNKYKIIFFFWIAILSLSAFSDEAHILCVNKKYQYNWLPQKEYGSWRMSEGFFADTNYFILNGGAHSYLKLKLRCSKLFQNEYTYVLAVNNIGDKWSSVAINDSIIVPAPWDDPKYILDLVSLIKLPF
ncbi:hypothetical protein [Fluviispira vulneris]|uniref:hypothetical protein n=1 Tax=Fluviispira vulneris TaxID=2763012 RepID=UPI0016469C1D|nr:hypothetical protein [Fluviispira vulneris]